MRARHRRLRRHFLRVGTTLAGMSAFQGAGLGWSIGILRASSHRLVQALMASQPEVRLGVLLGRLVPRADWFRASSFPPHSA